MPRILIFFATSKRHVQRKWDIKIGLQNWGVHAIFKSQLVPEES
jgi:hypothetical protein